MALKRTPCCCTVAWLSSLLRGGLLSCADDGKMLIRSASRLGESDGDVNKNRIAFFKVPRPSQLLHHLEQCRRAKGGARRAERTSWMGWMSWSGV